jgi:hypothetical protein
MRWKFNRAWRVVLIVLVVLVGIRLVLPFIVTRYVNRVLSEIEGYNGTIDDVDLHLIRGAYQIHGIRITKTDGDKHTPFVEIPHTDLSIEWNALFRGSLVGEITFDKPVLNFVGSKKDSVKAASVSSEGKVQAGQHTDWTEPIKRLMPFDINRLRINNGKITFKDFSTKPEVNIALNNVQMDAINLNNASDNPEKLPSRIYVQALSIGNGQLNLAMKANLMKEIPDLDFDLRFENINMRALNDFFKAYAKVDIEKGNFNLYSEVAVLNGNITGYVKPLFKDLKVIGENDLDKPAEVLWESMVGFLTEVFENQKKKQFATSVPLEGQIAEVNTPFLPAVWNVFSNAFVEAFSNNTDGTISLASAEKSSKHAVIAQKSKKEIRRERRKERRKAKKEKKAKLENEKADHRKGNKDNS